MPVLVTFGNCPVMFNSICGLYPQDAPNTPHFPDISATPMRTMIFQEKTHVSVAL